MNAVLFTPLECVQNLTVEQIVGVPVPLLKVDIVEAVQLVPSERIEERVKLTQAQIMDMLCRRSRRVAWTLCRSYHKSAFRIARRSRSCLSLCRRSRRTSWK